MVLDLAILSAVLLAGVILLSPRLRRIPAWRAMTTPLASIIGSGFLVLGPILDSAYGQFAPLAMAALCLCAYAYGAAIRHNMVAAEVVGRRLGPLGRRLETVSSATLSFAYVISVAYYLNLFGAFGVSLTPVNDQTHAKMLTTAIYALILFVGLTRGFRMLERMEYLSVTLKLAVIAGLLVGLAAYFLGRAQEGGLVLNPPDLTGWPALTLAFGLIVTVQGFETSRYLGAEYDTGTLIQSMRWAQWLSAAIYMIYVVLVAYVFERMPATVTETSIVDMTGVVAPILPVLLVAAALAAQFSAAVADTTGSGGLLDELTSGRLDPRRAYAATVGIGLALTWTANVFEIISYASRAFAAYYMLQAVIAVVLSRRSGASPFKSLGFAALAALGLLIVVFGQPMEG